MKPVYIHTDDLIYICFEDHLSDDGINIISTILGVTNSLDKAKCLIFDYNKKINSFKDLKCPININLNFDFKKLDFVEKQKYINWIEKTNIYKKHKQCYISFQKLK